MECFNAKVRSELEVELWSDLEKEENAFTKKKKLAPATKPLPAVPQSITQFKAFLSFKPTRLDSCRPAPHKMLFKPNESNSIFNNI